MSLTTGDNTIDALVGSSWNTKAGKSVALTYSFMSQLPDVAKLASKTGFLPMTATQEAGAEKAMALWAAVANVTFTEVASGGQIQFGTNNQGTASSGSAYLPDGRGNPVYLFINNVASANSSFADGGYGLETMLHEIGHTLGLKHPGDYDATGATTNGPFLPKDSDVRSNTIMSYNNDASFDLLRKYGDTPMLYDIQAMQYLYGANMTYHTGDDVYKFTDKSAPQCIWDAGGSDTLDFSACTGFTRIDLNSGYLSTTAPGYDNVSIAYHATIERAVAGNGGSAIYANDAGNMLQGGIGADSFHQGAGNDTVIGGGGSDTVFFTHNYADYLFTGNLNTLTVTGEGTDLLTGISKLQFADRAITLGIYAAVQTGTGGNDVLTAVAGSELVTGGAGLDVEKFGGTRANYSVKANGAEFSVLDMSGNGGTDLLSGVERLQFADGSAVALDIGGAAGQTYRLYQAAFNRKPDAGGVGFWLDQLDHGLSLLKMAQFFLDSPESVSNYGKLDNTAFVDLMYQNVLHRAPDASGLKFYLDGFDAGTFTRAQVLQGFSESSENQAAVIGSITNGVEYTIV
ncbi:DUF4214 domain-containing protein [Duganella sp. CT11-25]|jgi:hypothetical protein|uniref:DUF4214 domain-containing protein n=1 Tax=unclassified Duganella TaxID=2636909 RepID=UPI0039B10A5C